MAHEVEGAAAADRSVPDPVGSVVQEILSAIPAGCTWLLPVLDGSGRIVDFRIGAVSDQRRDIYGRGAGRVGALLSALYPSMVDGPLWRMYGQVFVSNVSDHLADFRYEEKRPGVVADSVFDVMVHPALGGLLVSWQRIDESQRRLDRTELLGRLGWAEYDLATGLSQWSPGMYRIFERDPVLGPMSRAEQAAALLPDDRGISETAWQTLDSGAVSEVTARFRFGDSVKYLRIRSDVARDADGAPLKIYAVLQDITAPESSRTEIERLRDQLQTREMTALAEHRLAAQLQGMIQPVPREPFVLNGVEAMVTYLPAESASQVGGDWYHAQTMPDGQVVLAIGDVAGHGLDAASGMAHLRYGLIAWLSIGIRDPGTLLTHLNQLCRQLAITGTAVVAFYEPTSRTLRWARAGHMAPLLARAGVAQALDRPAGIMLGAVGEPAYPVLAPCLEAGDLLLFYTDGLVERRSNSLDEQLDQVKQTMAEVSAGGPGQGISRLRSLLPQASPDDDTCTVLVRILP